MTDHGNEPLPETGPWQTLKSQIHIVNIVKLAFSVHLLGHESGPHRFRDRT